MDIAVDEFVHENLNNLDNVIAYCTGVANETVSVNIYETVACENLATKAKDLYLEELNPFHRPRFVPKAFGDFRVESVSQDAADLETRTIQKFYEYINLYRIGSWVFDTAMETLRHV